MKPEISKKIIANLKERGYIEINNCLYPPNSPQVALFIESGVYVPNKKKNRSDGLKRAKTGWVDDTLNLKNKNKKVDEFMALVAQALKLEVWPEFYFLLEKQYRFDYAIPVAADGKILKIAIEVEGGIWAKGLSGHSSGTGISRDMDKGTLANVNGWTLIRRTPSQLKNNETLELIRKAINTILNP